MASMVYFIILWNYGFPNATPLQDVIVAVILSILFIIIQRVQSIGVAKEPQEVNLKLMKGCSTCNSLRLQIHARR